jgi:hypothetical protein
MGDLKQEERGCEEQRSCQRVKMEVNLQGLIVHATEVVFRAKTSVKPGE